MGEKPGGLAQERALGLYPSQLLEEREGKHLRVRKPFEGSVATPSWVEVPVGVVDLAEQHDERLFQEDEFWSMLGMGHPMLLWSGSGRMALFYITKPRNTHLGGAAAQAASFFAGATQTLGTGGRGSFLTDAAMLAVAGALYGAATGMVLAMMVRRPAA
jgi:hypothetical protein